MIVIMRKSTYAKQLEEARKMGVIQERNASPRDPLIIKPLELKLADEDVIAGLIGIGVNHLLHILGLRKK